jgi:caspase domain-containing protein
MRVSATASVLVLIGLLSWVGARPGVAQSRDISTEWRAERRVALVIGNATYPTAALRTPLNDARQMAQLLRELGFTVFAHENATKGAMETAIVEFGRKLTEGGVGLFYYAGHGLQVRGHNYLVPVDARISSEAGVRIAAVDMDLVLEQMAEARNRVNVVILDACRNNPFEQRLRGSSRGLAAVDAARGTLIAYATAPGSVAADGEGTNGLYTQELLRVLRIPSLKVEEIFKQVRVGVTGRSKGAQTPWESSSLTGDLIINVTINVPGAVTTPATSSPMPTVDREALFWASIKDSNDPGGFEAYLTQYPDGTFAPLAKRRLATLTSPPSIANPNPVDAIVGSWDWYNGGIVELGAAGDIIVAGAQLGTWKRLEPGGRRYRLSWSPGWIDTLSLSADGVRLSGNNQSGRPVTATRR